MVSYHNGISTAAAAERRVNTMSKIVLKPVSGLEKCFLDDKFESINEYPRGSMLRGERFSYQLAFTDLEPGDWKTDVRVRIESPVAELVTLRRVENVPVRMPCNDHCADEGFIRTAPGLYPDLLRPFFAEKSRLCITGVTEALWVDVSVPEDSELSGIYPVTAVFVREDNGQEIVRCSFELEIIPAKLPLQKIKVTQWFHPDCLAAYYGVPVFSEEHWSIMARFIRCAVENGINMILTPIFTPALDTLPGGERPTVQLCDVYRDGGRWSFGFEKLERWIEMCLELGVEYFEMAHLFTQWGAHHAPKIMAHVDGEYKQVFGWDTDASADEYRNFLTELLPQLIDVLKRNGVDDCTVFHISDEPGGDHMESYMKAKEVVREQLTGQTIMDALSDFEFWKNGVVDCPVVSIDHMDPYLEAGVRGLWTYYCCCQWKGVSNRFVAMPTRRNRVIGQQMYKYDIAGFLQWGFNFYFAQHSLEVLDPYMCNDGNWWVPAGDAFSVYPAPGGAPYETIHLLGFTQAMYDMRAFSLAESLAGRDAVMSIIEERGPVSFKTLPADDDAVLGVRERINQLIKSSI